MTTATKLEQTDEDMNQIGSIYECEFHDLGGKKEYKNDWEASQFKHVLSQFND